MASSSKWTLYAALRYRPHMGQLAFHRGDARFKMLIAGTRFGKSLAAARDVLPLLSLSNTRGWIVAPTYRLGEKEFRYLASDVRSMAWEDISIINGMGQRPSRILTPWGGEVHVLSAARPDNLLGEEVDWMVLGEAAQLDAETWTRYLRGRLTTRGGRMIAPTTPAGFNWLHGLYVRGLDPASPQWRSFHYRTEDNPLIPRGEIEEARRTLSLAHFEEQYGGSFTSPMGLVYPEFDPQRHVTKVVDCSGEWERFGAVDFGYENPFVCLFAAVGQGGRLIVYDEYCATGRTLNAHMEALAGKGANALHDIVCDPSGAMWIAEMRGRGLSVKPAPGRKDVAWGIELVRRRLLPGEDGAPGLMVAERCVNLIREFTRYRWGDGRDERGERKPVKQDDHALDALRYLCMALEQRTHWRAVRAR